MMILPERAKAFTTSTLVEVAGCCPVTFRAWRNRNGLFPETAGKQGWNHFSVIDICVVRAIVVMTGHGLPASAAVWFCQEPSFDTHLAYAWAWPGEKSFCTFELAEREEDIKFSIPNADSSLESIMNASTGIMTVISLGSIVEHVRNTLRSLGKIETPKGERA